MKGSGLGYAILAVVMLLLYGIAMLFRGIVSAIVGTAVQQEANRQAKARLGQSSCPPPAANTGWQPPPGWNRPGIAPTPVCRAPMLADSEPDVLCQWCQPQFHDGGKFCTRCGTFTRSRLYCICHECASGRKGGLRTCESCNQPV
ncbi:MAG: hypothetical protein K2W95_15135 [Candidatus Obscuribacterales bacterium]|nr:hypothetical protein [Candidatus Obscuribacterales bacterium]